MAGENTPLAAVVAAFRRRAGLSQRTAAGLAGMSVGSLRDIEQGRVLRPREQTLRRLADAFHLAADEAEQLHWAASGCPPGRARVAVLGELRVVVDGAVVDVGSGTQRALLGLLALAPNTVVGRDMLIDAIWGDDPPLGAEELLRSRISRLRRRLWTDGSGTGLELSAAPGGYRLIIGEDQLDLLLFRRDIARAGRHLNAGELAQACAAFRSAVELWRGQPLTGLTAVRTHPAVVHMVDEVRSAVVAYAEVAASVGRFEEVLPWLRRVVGEEPLYEAAHAQLMIALAGRGQQAAALEVFERARRLLADELGVDPGPELIEAHRAVLSREVHGQHGTRGTDRGGDSRVRHSAVPSAHRQLPPDIADFTGREVENAELLDRMRTVTDGSTAIVISAIEGMGGIGKTRLAVHVAHRLAAESRYGDVALYVDLRGYADEPPAEPAAVLASFLRLLGIAGSHIPHGLQERAALYRDRLYGRKALVLLDNAASEEQVTPLLPAGPTNAVIVTSRRTLAIDGAHVLTLSAFTEAEADRFLTKVLGARRVQQDRAGVTRLIELCGRLPLAIALVARKLRSRPLSTPTELADRLESAGNRLTELAVGNKRLRAVFDLSYQALEQPERRMFRLLGLHPGEDFTDETAAALAGTTPERARSVLDALVGEHLVEVVRGGRYRIHDLLAEYARQVVRHDEPENERDAALGRLLDYYLSVALRAVELIKPHRWWMDVVPAPPQGVRPLVDREQALAWLNAERACLTAAVDVAARHARRTYAWQLAYAMWGFYFFCGHPHDWIRTHETALAAAIESGDAVGEAVTRTHLGAAYAFQRRIEEATRELHRGHEMHLQQGNQPLRMVTAGLLAFLYCDIGRFEDAIQYTRDTMTRAICLDNSHLLRRLKELAEAMNMLRRQTAVSGSDPSSRCAALADIGRACLGLGWLEDALDFLQHAHATSVANGLVGRETELNGMLADTRRRLITIQPTRHPATTAPQ